MNKKFVFGFRISIRQFQVLWAEQDTKKGKGFIADFEKTIPVRNICRNYKCYL